MEANAAADGASCARLVASDHDWTNPGSSYLGNERAHSLPWWVGQGDQSQPNEPRRFRIRFQRFGVADTQNSHALAGQSLVCRLGLFLSGSRQASHFSAGEDAITASEHFGRTSFDSNDLDARIRFMMRLQIVTTRRALQKVCHWCALSQYADIQASRSGRPDQRGFR
jgi:hypothetical protein